MATIKDGDPMRSEKFDQIIYAKTVNFLGPNDDSVASGSDDGNFFIWDKHDGRLQGIYEGDSSVVNIIEGHPYFPLVAVSGIDTTVKVRVLSFETRKLTRIHC